MNNFEIINNNVNNNFLKPQQYINECLINMKNIIKNIYETFFVTTIIIIMIF